MQSKSVDQAKRNLESALLALSCVRQPGVSPNPAAVVRAEIIKAARALGLELNH